MELSNIPNQKSEIIRLSSLKEGLSTLKMAELQGIRKKLRIKNISHLKKAELIQSLTETIPYLLKSIVSGYDERRFFLLKSFLTNHGVLNAKELGIEELEYFQKTGFTFSGEDNKFILFPLDILPTLEEVFHDEKLLSDIKRNTEWIKITRGLLYYYGVVPYNKLVDLVEKYTPINPHFLSYNYAIFDAMEYTQEFSFNQYGYTFLEVLEPLVILEEQASRKGLDYYPFSKKELIEAGETDFVEQPKGHSQLLSLFTKEYGKSKQEAIELIENCVMQAKMDNHPSQLLQFLQTQLTFESLEAVQRLMDAVVILMNNTRQWYLKGYTSVELSAKEKNFLQPLPNKKGQNNHLQTHQKVGRNDSCPCGSGKKFKKCCGN